MPLTVGATEVGESYFAFLLQRIAERSRDAEHELRLHFSHGIRFLLSRRLRPERAAELEEDIFSALLHAIRIGEVCDPESMTPFVREQIQRAIARETQPARLTTTIPSQDCWTADRILRCLSPVQREALIRYYQEEQPAGKICRDLKLTAAEFRRLRLAVQDKFKTLSS